MKLWYLLSFLFCCYSIGVLFDQRYDVTYFVTNSSKYSPRSGEKSDYQYLVCFPILIDALFGKGNKKSSASALNQSNASRSADPPHGKNNKFKASNLKSNIVNNMASNKIHEIQLQDLTSLMFDSLSALLPARAKVQTYLKALRKSGDYHFNSYHFCLRIADETILQSFNAILGRRSYRIFFYKRHPYPAFNSYSFRDNAVKDIYNWLQIDELKVSNLPHPYTDCQQDDEEQSSRFFCLNRCLKQRHRLLKYLYEANETGLVQMQWANQKTVNQNDEKILEAEKFCSKLCERENCELTFLLIYGREGLTFSSFTYHRYQAEALISGLDFWLQLVGLVCLFTGIPVYALTCKAYAKLTKKLSPKTKSSKRILLGLRLLLLVVGILYPVCFTVFGTARSYYDRKFDSKMQAITDYAYRITPLSLVFCMAIDYRLSDWDETKSVSHFTLSQLENLTDTGPKTLIRRIYVQYANEEQEIAISLSRKVYFINDLMSGTNRCFQMDVKLDHIPQFQSLLLNSKLIIVSYYTDFEMFLLWPDERLTSKSKRFVKDMGVQRNIVKRTSACFDYTQLNECKSRLACRDLCRSREYAKRYKNASATYFIDKDHFSDREWSSFYLVFKEDVEVDEFCKNKFPDKDCFSSWFEKDDHEGKLNLEFIEIDLHYETFSLIERDVASPFKLVLDLLGIQSIFFGATVLSSLNMIYAFVQAKLRFRENKGVHILIYLICVAGITAQSFFVVNEIINGNLIQSVHYDQLESFSVPETIFCVQINGELIDPHHRLTVGYLQRLTEQIQFETLFERIEYLNQSDFWKNVDFQSLTSFKSSTSRGDSPVQLRSFFFMGLKCLAISVELDYRFDFYRPDAGVLRFFLNRKLVRSKYENVYFFTKQRRKAEYSKIQLFRFNSLIEEPVVYAIKLEQFEMIHSDNFQFLRNPLLMLHDAVDLNDPHAYIEHLLSTFRAAFALTTKRLPLDEQSLEIDEELFIQFYWQTQHQADVTMNFQRQIILSHKSVFREKRGLPHIEIVPLYFKTSLFVSNSDNIARLILNVINVLATWLQVCFFDLHLYLGKVRGILRPFHRMLLKLAKLFDPFRQDTCIIYDYASVNNKAFRQKLLRLVGVAELQEEISIILEKKQLDKSIRKSHSKRSKLDRSVATYLWLR